MSSAPVPFLPGSIKTSLAALRSALRSEEEEPLSRALYLLEWAEHLEAVFLCNKLTKFKGSAVRCETWLLSAGHSTYTPRSGLHFCPSCKAESKAELIFSVCRVPCRSSSRRTSSLNRSWTNCETSSGRSTPCWPSGAETPRAGRRSGLGCSLWTGHHRPAENTGTMTLYTFRGHGEEGGVDDGRGYSVYLDETSVGNTFSFVHIWTQWIPEYKKLL